MKRTHDTMINIATAAINLVLVFLTHRRVQNFWAFKCILWCTWTGCVKCYSFRCDHMRWYTFPLIVVVCHRTKTCGCGWGNLLTYGNDNCLVARQSEWHNSASVTTGLVTRGPLLSPCGSTLRGRHSAVLNSTHHVVKPSCSAISTVKKNCGNENDENLE